MAKKLKVKESKPKQRKLKEGRSVSEGEPASYVSEGEPASYVSEGEPAFHVSNTLPPPKPKGSK